MPRSYPLSSPLRRVIVSGDPNSSRAWLNLPPAIQWNHPDSSSNSAQNIAGVLNVGNALFSTLSDSHLPKNACDFWVSWLAAATVAGGYAPPGAIVPQNFLAYDVANASSNYVGGNTVG